LIIKNDFLQFIVNDVTGSLKSFSNGKKEFIFNNGKYRPLFTVRFRDNAGKPVDMTSSDAQSIQVVSGTEDKETKVDIAFKALGNLDVNANVKISCSEGDPLTYWNLAVENNTDFYIEWIDFPDVVVPNDLAGNGGDAKLLWPAAEGVVIEDIRARENSMWFKYGPSVYPAKGWEGIYPGPASTQFMAYYDRDGGLYLGAHDNQCNVKAIEFYRYDEDGIRLEFKLFPGAIGKGKYRMEFDMVLGVFTGDWYDAADIYRRWYESSAAEKPVRIAENKLIPEWTEESPIVVSYPVRGKYHVGNMDPNNEYYPFINAVPYLEKLSEDTDSKVMALLMHWEGTAPWAPPYVWPPLGGEEGFRKFIDKMHEDGNLVGVYCSGIGWTQESVIVKDYNRRMDFDKQNLKDIMCESPEGELPYSNICTGEIRWGYDMCPANDRVKEITAEEISKIAEAGVDYIQFFDQNLGGAPYTCYSKKHGHPPAPGKWRNEAMIELITELNKAVSQYGRKVAIGCEVGAAEPFIPYLPFNELRYCATFDLGRPVPLYQYLFHEYLNSFMGNQISSCLVIDINKSPDNILMRMALAFIIGEMFTFVFREKGTISWDWGTEWSLPAPDQDKVKKLVKHLNAWRKYNGKPFLHLGRMYKPYELKNVKDRTFEYYDGRILVMPSILTSRWSSPDGREAQVLANYTDDLQNVTLVLKGQTGKKVKVFEDARNEFSRQFTVDKDEVNVRVEPLAAVMVEII
jgi:hypothetical protein